MDVIDDDTKQKNNTGQLKSNETKITCPKVEHFKSIPFLR